MSMVALFLVVAVLVMLAIGGIFLHVLFWVLGGVLGLFVYFAPALVAVLRRHRNAVWILVLDIALAWSGVAWIVLLVWALAGKTFPPEFLSRDSRPFFRRGR